jgi:uncharacterized C2H2 Zn-finger protein
MNDGEMEKFDCPLCGNVFKKDSQVCLKGCPMGKTCNLISCPRCHYHFMEESKMVNLFKRIWKGRGRGADGKG